jgi:hypothetical protein
MKEKDKKIVRQAVREILYRNSEKLANAKVEYNVTQEAIIDTVLEFHNNHKYKYFIYGVMMSLGLVLLLSVVLLGLKY